MRPCNRPAHFITKACPLHSFGAFLLGEAVYGGGNVTDFQTMQRCTPSVTSASLGLLLAGLVGLLSTQFSRGQVVLNEILAENQETLENGDDFPDYIELLNL